MQLSIITINFKKPELTIACLTSLYSSYTQQFEKNLFEFLIVDNNSEDSSVEILEKEIKKKKYKNVTVLSNEKNSGFGGGNNFGAIHAKGDTLLFLNNDTVVGKGVGNMLTFLLDNPHIGVLGGILKNTNGTSQHSFDTFYSLPRVLLLLLGMQRFQFQNVVRPQRVDWVKGACLMIGKDLFTSIGRFDEEIFMYTEDMELCYRASKIGKDVWVFPDIDIHHRDQGSSNRTFAIVNIYKGILYFYKKHRSLLEYSLVKLLLQSKAQILILLGKLIKNDYLTSTYEKALNTL